MATYLTDANSGIYPNEQGSDLGKRLLSDYKEGKAFSYFDSQWLKEVFYHPISDTHELCFLVSRIVYSKP